jgi:hypothetical protein
MLLVALLFVLLLLSFAADCEPARAPCMTRRCRPRCHAPRRRLMARQVRACQMTVYAALGDDLLAARQNDPLQCC